MTEFLMYKRDLSSLRLTTKDFYEDPIEELSKYGEIDILLRHLRSWADHMVHGWRSA